MDEESISMQFQSLTTIEIEAREWIAVISDPNVKLSAKEVQDKNNQVRNIIAKLEKDAEVIKLFG